MLGHACWLKKNELPNQSIISGVMIPHCTGTRVFPGTTVSPWEQPYHMGTTCVITEQPIASQEPPMLTLHEILVRITSFASLLESSFTLKSLDYVKIQYFDP
ncbi:hypothetical protein M9H77_23013 [Catharanthus roseus]|uniref:Uncharacterized protein n=1 Tax=Catharanthus roseus TaxID=4058 RepID=A0ACC0ATM1_CATRO|nr:hypothetical protein M9H77_23013 [Catharanthus roseus]